VYERQSGDATDQTGSADTDRDSNYGGQRRDFISSKQSSSRAARSTGRQHIRSTETPNSTVHSLSRIVVSANGIPSYHGQTSALFEEHQQARGAFEMPPRMPDDWVEKGLVAEAARQRLYKLSEQIDRMLKR
jgi:hypothetical protein